MPPEDSLIDWSGCPEVERIPGKVSGAPILKHSRVPADAILENPESGLSAEGISYQFTVPLEQVNFVLCYAAKMNIDLAS